MNGIYEYRISNVEEAAVNELANEGWRVAHVIQAFSGGDYAGARFSSSPPLLLLEKLVGGTAPRSG